MKYSHTISTPTHTHTDAQLLIHMLLYAFTSHPVTNSPGQIQDSRLLSRFSRTLVAVLRYY